MAIKEVTPQNNYVAALGALFNGTLEKKQGPFHKAIEVVFDYVQKKNEGRCTAVEVFDDVKRAEMIQALFDKYRNGADLYTICFRDRFMQQITTHDDANKINLKFIYKTIVPGEIDCFSNKEELKDAPEVLLWLREFDATVMDPVIVSTQKEIFEKLPEEYQKKLADLRGGIGEHLIHAATNKWLNKEQIALIIEAIQAKNWENTSQLHMRVLFSKEQTVPFFTQSYRFVIDQVDKYAKDETEKLEYRDLVTRSLVLGLTQFSKDPIMNDTRSSLISDAIFERLKENVQQSSNPTDWYNYAFACEQKGNISEARAWYSNAANLVYHPAIQALKRIAERS